MSRARAVEEKCRLKLQGLVNVSNKLQIAMLPCRGILTSKAHSDWLTQPHQHRLVAFWVKGGPHKLHHVPVAAVTQDLTLQGKDSIGSLTDQN
jgi:hypothetical protein